MLCKSWGELGSYRPIGSTLLVSTFSTQMAYGKSHLAEDIGLRKDVSTRIFIGRLGIVGALLVRHKLVTRRVGRDEESVDEL